MPLWDPSRVAGEIAAGRIGAHLSPPARAALAQMPLPELRRAVAVALERPQPADMSLGRRVLTEVLAAQYLELFGYLQLPAALTVFEPCVGASDPVILAAEAHSDGRARYTAINLNRPLREELRLRTAHLGSQIRVIDDDAGRLLRYLAPRSVDVVCFHHAINDILQTAVAEPRGMDTAAIDWWPHERQMIEWLAQDYRADGLVRHGRPELLQIVGAAVEVLRPGGILIFDHWAWEGHRREPWFPWDLFCDLVPLARSWIAAAGLPLTEFAIPGADARWWMFHRLSA